MKRDMELVRKILIAIEDSNNTMGSITLNFDNYSDEQVSYHVKLLSENGLIKAIDASSHDVIAWMPTGLTWDGHDYIEAIKDDKRWQKVKKWISDNGKLITIETIKQGVQDLFM